MTIGERIREKRIGLNMTLEDVAARLNLSRQTLSRYETGVISNIPLTAIEKLANALQTTPCHLAGWDAYDSKEGG